MPHRERAPIVRTSALEKFEIGLKVKAEMWQDDNGFWHYKPGWNDEAIAHFVAKKLGVDKSLNKGHVINIRREICGIMKPRTLPVAKATEPKDRFEALERRIEGLALEIAELQRRMDSNER